MGCAFLEKWNNMKVVNGVGGEETRVVQSKLAECGVRWSFLPPLSLRCCPFRIRGIRLLSTLRNSLFERGRPLRLPVESL